MEFDPKIKPSLWNIKPGVIAYNCRKYGFQHPRLALPMWERSGHCAFDQSGHWNCGELTNGASWGDNGLIFDGVNDHVHIPHKLNSSIDFADEDFAISIWFKSTTALQSNYMFSKGYGGVGAKWYGLSLYTPGPYLAGFIDDGTVNSQVQSTDDFNDGKWHHLVFVRDTVEDKIIFYVDGDWNAEVVDGSGSVANTGDLVIGGRADLAVDRFYDGNIKSFDIYGFAPTPRQVKFLYNNSWFLYQIPDEFNRYISIAGVTLTVADLNSSGILDNTVLNQKHILAIQELLSSGTLDNIDVTQKHTLSVQELLSSGILDNTILTQKHFLSVQELLSSGTLDGNINLTQKHLLAIQELLSSGALDNVGLIQKYILSVQDLLSTGQLDNIALTQKHLLAVQDLLSPGLLDNIELSISTLLIVSNLLSTGQLDNVEPTQKHILSIDEVLSAGQLDSVSLTQKNLLDIDDLISSGVIDNIEFDIATGLLCITLTQATEYDINLTQSAEYNINLTQIGDSCR